MVQTITMDGCVEVYAICPFIVTCTTEFCSLISLCQRGGDVGDRKEPGGPLQHLVQS